MALFGQCSRLGLGLRSTFGRISRERICITRYLSLTPVVKLDLKGVYPPMPTPFNNDESIAYDKLEENIAAWDKISFRGLVVQGSNGEYVYLDDDERIELVKRVREFLPSTSKKLILAGSGCESTKGTIKMSEKMAEAGADAVMVVTPNYYKAQMNEKALCAHYTAVADKSPVPVILYSVPAFTVIDLSLDAIVNLAHHPNIIAIKESSGDITKIGAMVHMTESLDFQVIAGSASFLLATLQIGGVGGVAALANVLGEECCELHKLFVEGNLPAAVDLQKKLIAPNSAVTKGFGIPGLKKVMDWKGLYGGPLRSPLQPLSEIEVEKLKNIFTDSGYL